MNNSLFVSVLLLAMVSTSFQQIVFNGTWLLSSVNLSSCPQPNQDMYFRVNETNHTTHSVELSYYYKNGTKMLGKCTAVNTSVECGSLTTVLTCEKSSMFNNLLSNYVFLTWDSYDNNKLTYIAAFNITYGFSSWSNETCQYTSYPFTYSWRKGDWVVTNCSCDPGCCYQPGTVLSWKDLDDYQNRPYHNLSGTLRGGYWCNNTMAQNDRCYFTSSSSYGNYTANTLVCETLGCRNNNKATALYFNNYTAVLAWGAGGSQCVAKLSLVGAPNSGERMGIMMLFIFGMLALLAFLN